MSSPPPASYTRDLEDDVMDNLSVDSLAIAALGGFAVLLGIGIGLTVWFIKQAYKEPEEPKVKSVD